MLFELNICVDKLFLSLESESAYQKQTDSMSPETRKDFGHLVPCIESVYILVFI